MSARRVDVGGLALFVRDEGAGSPVLLLHGFTGCGETLDGLAEALRARHRVLRVDLVGHGRSDAPESPDRYAMDACVADLVALLDRVAVRDAHVVGYSLGGRVAIALAAHAPERVRSLATVGASPGIASAVDRRARVRADAALAARIETEGVEAFVERWMALPLFASQRRLGPAALARAREQRLRNHPHALALSLRGMGAGAQRCYADALARLSRPTLFLAGAEDAKYRDLARQMAGSAARASSGVRIVPDAGHAAHLEQPTVVADALRDFLARADAATSPSPTEDTERRPLMTTVDPEHADRKHADPSPVDPNQLDPNCVDWKPVRHYQDIRFDAAEGIARITIARPEVRNAFRPTTLFELCDAFNAVRDDPRLGVVLFTGEGPDAFCSGGDQKVRGDAGYVGDDGVPRLNALDLQRVIRTLPKPVIALVAGYAIGGGHVLHMVCDLTIAADNARFGQTGPRVGSFDGGFGASYMARIVGQKKAREIWYLCRQYDAQAALDMGLVNTVVPLAQLEAAGVEWARRILEHSPTAIRCLKAALNADCDGQAGLQELAGEATRLFYMSEEAQEGRDAFLEKRQPDFGRFPWRP